MTNAYVVTGTLIDATTVRLDEPLPLTGGTVRVVVEAADAPPAKADFRQVLHRIWAEQEARGYVPRSAEEIEQQIREERDSWGD